jgi:hypothetical protein
MPHNLLPLRAGELGARTASVSSRETSSRTSTKDDEAEASARGEDDAGTAGARAIVSPTSPRSSGI